MIPLIIVIIVLVLLLVWGISVHNALVKSDELCKNALKQINVQQVSRFDALKALVKLTKEYAAYEGETLEKVIQARNISVSPSPSVSEINQNEGLLEQIAGKLLAVAEAYPDLKANASYMKTMSSVEKYEENVRLSRMTFNDTVTRFNNQVRMLPGSVMASMLGFTPKEYLKADLSKTEYPEF